MTEGSSGQNRMLKYAQEIGWAYVKPGEGRVFKSFLYAYLPDWEERQRELAQYAHQAQQASRRRKR